MKFDNAIKSIVTKHPYQLEDDTSTTSKHTQHIKPCPVLIPFYMHFTIITLYINMYLLLYHGLKVIMLSILEGL